MFSPYFLVASASAVLLLVVLVPFVVLPSVLPAQKPQQKPIATINSSKVLTAEQKRARDCSLSILQYQQSRDPTDLAKSKKLCQ